MVSRPRRCRWWCRRRYAILQVDVETRLKQHVVPRPEQEDRRKIGHGKAAVLPVHLAELDLRVAHHREVVRRALRRWAWVDRLHLAAASAFCCASVAIFWVSPTLLQLLDVLLVLFVRLLVLFVHFFQLAIPLVLVGDHASQGIEFLILSSPPRAESGRPPARKLPPPRLK